MKDEKIKEIIKFILNKQGLLLIIGFSIILIPIVSVYLNVLNRELKTDFNLGTAVITCLIISVIIELTIKSIKITRANAKIEVEGINLKKKDGTFGTADWGTEEEIQEYLGVGKRNGIILGQTENKQMITLPLDTYLNKNIAVFRFFR